MFFISLLAGMASLSSAAKVTTSHAAKVTTSHAAHSSHTIENTAMLSPSISVAGLDTNVPTANIRSHGVVRHAPIATTINAASGAILEASFSAHSSALASIPAIPVPPNISNPIKFSQLVGNMPPLQDGLGVDTISRRDSVTILSGHDDDLTSRLAMEEHMAFYQNATQLLESLRPPLPAPKSTMSHLQGRAAPLRVMIVGDSMSQGQQGDWTWRYRIWQWFQSQGIDVELVGPYPGTMQPNPPEPPSPPPLYNSPTTSSTSPIKTSGGYASGADPAFTNTPNHFAVWGRAAAVDKGLIQDVVAQNPPDLMLLMLGFNDIGWFYSDAQGTLDSIYTLIKNARAANPNLAFAVADIPMRTSLGSGRADLPIKTNEYNEALPGAIAQWTTNQSPITLVQLRENYACELDACPAGYDGLHPNAWGEYQIAAAFSRSLHNGFGYGSAPLAVPDQADVPARPLPVPSNFAVSASPGGILATWDAVYGAYGYDVYTSITGTTAFSGIGSVGSNRYDGTWTVPGLQYNVQVRVNCGLNQIGQWTTLTQVVPEPQTASAPDSIVVTSTSDGMEVSWDLPTGPYNDSITEYNVIYYDYDSPCSFLGGAAFLNSPASITGLNVGHRYLVALAVYNAAGGGFPGFGRDVIIGGGGAPGAPTGLQIIAVDPTTVHLTWDSLPGAAGYLLWSRETYNDDNASYVLQNGTADQNCVDDYFLFPGTQYFGFCISGFNGNSVGPRGSCVMAPSATSGAPSPTCPPAPPLCPLAASSMGTGPPTTTLSVPGSGTGGQTTTNTPGPGGVTTTLTIPGAGPVTTEITTITTNGQTLTITLTDATQSSPGSPPQMTTITSAGQTITLTMPPPASLTANPIVPPQSEQITTVTTDGQTFTLALSEVPSSSGSPPQFTTITTQGVTFTLPLPARSSTSAPPYITTLITTTNSNGYVTVESATLYPTTGTDSNGNTVVGTVTQGPITSPPVVTGLTTYTTFPSGVTWSTTSAASNTHDGSGHPVLGAWPLCWFCPPGGGGIVLTGIGPGVYPGGGPPAGLPTPFPPLTIEPDGTPEYPTEGSEQESTTTSTSSCTQASTLTDCDVVCTTYPDFSTAYCTTTTCNTITACSATPTTSTSMATQYMTCESEATASASDNGVFYSFGSGITSWLPDDFITVFQSFISATAPPSSTSTPAPSPPAPSTTTSTPSTTICHIHATETIDRSEDVNGNTFHIYVAGELDTGDTKNPVATIPKNTNDIYTNVGAIFNSKGVLPYIVNCSLSVNTGTNEDLTFTYGPTTWDTTDTNSADPRYCNVGKYATVNNYDQRQMDCYFPC